MSWQRHPIRFVMILALVAVATARVVPLPAAADPPPASDQERLQGVWTMSQAELAARPSQYN
jgi:hypothetical protein